RHCYQLERDKDKNEIDCRNEVHQTCAGKKRQRNKFAKTRLQCGAGKEAAHHWGIINRHDQYENGGYQRELLEEDRQPICSVKIRKTCRMSGRGGGNKKKAA